MTSASFLDVAGVPAVQLCDDLKALIRHGSDSMARSKQKALGPSEVGHPCARKLAYGLMDEPGGNTASDPLAALFGTAMHAWLEWAALQDNLRLGRTRWLTERKVECRPGLSGTADLYDCDTGTVIDWKCPGPTRYAYYLRNGPSRTYRVQAHLYGYGYAREGFPVRNVAIAFLPRANTLSRTHVWMEPYDPAVATETFERIDTVTGLLDGLAVETHPERYALIPTHADLDCGFCKWWSPNPQTPLQCPGAMPQVPS